MVRSRKIQLYHHVVVVREEQLIDRRACDVGFAIFDAFVVERRLYSLKIGGEKGEVVKGSGIRRRTAADRVLPRDLMHYRHIAAVEPKTGEVEIQAKAHLETENVPIELARRFEVVGPNGDVVKCVQWHRRDLPVRILVGGVQRLTRPRRRVE